MAVSSNGPSANFDHFEEARKCQKLIQAKTNYLGKLEDSLDTMDGPLLGHHVGETPFLDRAYGFVLMRVEGDRFAVGNIRSP